MALGKVARDRITPQDRKSRDFFEGRLALLAIDCLLADDSGTSKFDFVVLDEAQDLLRPHYLDVLDLVLEGGAGWRALADDGRLCRAGYFFPWRAHLG